jgi:hypothetical protein
MTLKTLFTKWLGISDLIDIEKRTGKIEEGLDAIEQRLMAQIADEAITTRINTIEFNLKQLRQLKINHQ